MKITYYEAEYLILIGDEGFLHLFKVDVSF